MPCFTTNVIELDRKIKELASASSEVSAAAVNVSAHYDGSEEEAIKIINEQADSIIGNMNILLVALEEIGGQDHTIKKESQSAYHTFGE